MSYLVFARRFRPQRFEDLLGQDPVTATLRRAIEQKRIGHAYLFAGPRGTGKTSTARIFAKALNCEKGPIADPCNECGSCKEITEGRSLDVIEIDGASNRLIEDIRSLRENVKFAPAKSTFKIYIIDEFHQITPDAFNALLKTLEEPPPHVKFIFATTAPHKVPATILSRCQRYEFKRLPASTILQKLKEIVQEEKVKVPEEALVLVSRAAAGSLRDGESLLDQLAVFGQGKVQMSDVEALLGFVEDKVLSDTVDAIIQQKPADLLKIIAGLADAGRDLNQYLSGLIGCIRNLMVARLGKEAQEILETTPEAFARLQSQAEALTEEELQYLFYLLAGTYEVMRRVGDARTPLEVALIRASRREPVAKISELIRQLEQSPRAVTPAPSPIPTPPPARPISSPPPAPPASSTTKTSPKPASTPKAEVVVEEAIPEEAAGSIVSLDMLKSQWPQILSYIRQKKMSTASYLLEAQPTNFSGGKLVLGFPKTFGFHKDAVDCTDHRTLIEEAFLQISGIKARVTVEISEALEAGQNSISFEDEPEDDSPAPGEPLPLAEDAPPILRSAAELFGGKIAPKRTKE
ncbi:MAG: DNA polymerase III subunit gamma/tau [Candidatus Omnitrophica bacterium]|nr:DNA polymerase III subunit gamma/tau [Candidatus Omnitrophota bacterium]